MAKCLCGPDYNTEESIDLISHAQANCRNSRMELTRRDRTKKLLSYVLRFVFWSAGYNKRMTRKSQVYSLILFAVCWYQTVYEIYKLCGCPEFTCNVTNRSYTRELEYIAYVSSSTGSACSFTFMLLCLNLIYKPLSNAISPYAALRDMINTKAKIVLSIVLTTATMFLGYVIIFVYIVGSADVRANDMRFVVYLISITCQLIAQWVGLVSLYAFTCSSFAIGAFAGDTLRRIQAQKHGTIDDVIKIHKELRSIVSDTTSAYSAWFLLHWLIYGVSVIIGFVVVALYKFGHDQLISKIYFGTFFAQNVFLFVFPCICAAYVTTTCGSIATKINNTTSEDWDDDHIFQQRQQLQTFVSYCMASPICFKIGRVTFTSTLAWFSLFFGGTGLLFHFF